MSDRYISDILFLGSHFIMFGLYPWYLLICLVRPGNLCLKSCWISMSLCCILLSWIRCIYSAIKALCICPFIFCRKVIGSCRVCHWKMCSGSPRCSSNWRFSWKNAPLGSSHLSLLWNRIRGILWTNLSHFLCSLKLNLDAIAESNP